MNLAMSFCGRAAPNGVLFWDHPILGVVSSGPWRLSGDYSPPQVSHQPVHVLAMSAGSEAMVEKERPPSNYSISDETKREQRRGLDNGHPRLNRLIEFRVLQDRTIDML
jgi:hypothetical protein